MGFDEVTYLPTFAEWLADPSRADLVKTALPADAVARWVRYDQAMFALFDGMRDSLAAAGLMKAEHFTTEVALSLVRQHLGGDWLARNLRAPMAKDAPLTRLLAFYRAMQLGRRLYELQSYPWFDALLRKLKRDTFSGVTFELEVLSMLQTLPLGATAVPESGVKGADFDVTATYKDLEIPIEAKAKDDNTAWVSNGVIKTIKKAASQFPVGSCGVVFLRIPHTWIGERLEQEYPTALADATRQTSRVGAVFTVIDKPHLNKGSKTVGSVTQVYDCFRRDAGCPQDVWEMCLSLRNLLEAGARQLGPVAPF